MNEYCNGVLRQVHPVGVAEPYSVGKMLALRRLTIGVRPLFPLIEYACQLTIEQHIFTDPAIVQLHELIVDIVSL